MIKNRQEEILKIIKPEGSVTVNLLVEYLGVSPETIRRDLTKMEDQGMLKRVYGGAVLHKPVKQEEFFLDRVNRASVEKKMVAQKAAELVSDGDTIMIDVGTTNLEFARAILSKKNLTIITNSLHVAVLLTMEEDFNVYLLGGRIRKHEYSTSGMLCEQNLDSFNADKVIIGASGISAENGVTDYVESEIRLRQKMMKKARQIILLADSSKINQNAILKVCDIDDIDVVVTDNLISAEDKETFENHGVEVIVVEDKADPKE